MRSRFPLFLAGVGVLALAFAAACDDSSAYEPPGIQPQIVTVIGPAGATVVCHPVDTGGNCPLPITVTFRLPKEQFVTRAVVRFQGDGSDVGYDRIYAVSPTYGNDGADVTVTVDADIPATILRRNALFTYSVVLVTGAGAKSPASTLTVSVT
ncbi:MAG: hypothetical protein KIT84_29785 [Labilithrix sp.]|nr:hypothetical protein [Labilithrix sp.]MCW5815255.1 hypothetical protein [Labilithrix sp.]